MSLLVLAIWFICCLLSIFITVSRGLNLLGGFLLAAFLGPLAIPILLLLPVSATKQGLKSGQLLPCPACRQAIPAIAVKCHYCASTLPSKVFLSQSDKAEIWADMRRPLLIAAGVSAALILGILATSK